MRMNEGPMPSPPNAVEGNQYVEEYIPEGNRRRSRTKRTGSGLEFEWINETIGDETQRGSRIKRIATSFPWITFFSRIGGMYVIAVLWIVRDTRSHRIYGVIAALTTAAIGSLICYRWTRPKPN